MTAYGNQIERSPYNPQRDLIGELSRSPAGNIIIRTGREIGPLDDGSWTRTGHIVLLPTEARELCAAIGELLGDDALTEGQL